MTKKKEINYFETFTFPDIPGQLYPVYSVSEKGNVFNLKSIIYPTPKSVKKFTRRKQLIHRSLLAKIFDSLINIGYFNPLPVWKEFPIIILNHLRLKNQEGSYYLLDYYFPTMGIAVELDSELHNLLKDLIRDKYLLKLGIATFRMDGFEKESVLKGKFHELTKLLRDISPSKSPRLFSFLDNIERQKGKR